MTALYDPGTPLHEDDALERHTNGCPECRVSEQFCEVGERILSMTLALQPRWVPREAWEIPAPPVWRMEEVGV